MKRLIPPLLDMAHFLALAVWLGGLLTLWLALMPAAFHGAGLTLREAESVVGETLRHFTGIIETCGLTMIAAQFLMRRRYQRDRARFVADGARQLLTFGALLLAEFCLRSLLPQMDAARQVVHLGEFHALHQQYAIMATIESALLIGVGVVTTWLQSPAAVTAAQTVGKAPATPSAVKPADAASRSPKAPKPAAARRPARNR